MDKAGLTEEEKARLRGGLTITNGEGDPSHGAWLVSGTNQIVLNTPTLSRYAAPGSSYASDVVAVFLFHELYHVEPPGSGGCGPDDGGVQDGPTGVVSCNHIGLQLWSAKQTCADAQSAFSAGNTALANVLCDTFSDLAGPLMKGGDHYKVARQCVLDGHSATLGPPSWDFFVPALSTRPILRSLSE